MELDLSTMPSFSKLSLQLEGYFEENKSYQNFIKVMREMGWEIQSWTGHETDDKEVVYKMIFEKGEM